MTLLRPAGTNEVLEVTLLRAKQAVVHVDVRERLITMPPRLATVDHMLARSRCPGRQVARVARPGKASAPEGHEK